MGKGSLQQQIIQINIPLIPETANEEIKSDLVDDTGEDIDISN